MKRMLRVFAVLMMFSVVVFQGPLADAASVTSAAPPRVVVVSGSNYEMGVQYGEQAADLIAANQVAIWNILDTQVVDGTGVPLGRSVILKDMQVWTYYLEKYNPKQKDWLLGISRGCKNKGVEISYVDLVAAMAYLNELWARPAGDYPPETGVVASASSKNMPFLAKTRSGTRALSSCTSFAATRSATQDGRPMNAITVGASRDVKNLVILIAFPTDGERFVTLTQAGRISSNVGMNSKYAWLMTAAVTSPWACPSSWGVTSEVYFHYLIQYAKSPQEAVNYLNTTPRGGVTGIFLFADPSTGDVFANETGSCTSVIRRPGDLGEKDFVATTNDYNDPGMIGNNLPAEWFPDTYVRYATIFEKLKAQTQSSVIDLNFTKGVWAANDWYDTTTSTWNTVPVPNDPNDPNICNVPGNICEGGIQQIIQFPAKKTVYLEAGVPHGTSVQYYWPDNPKPTGEYTKWQLKDSIYEVSKASSSDVWIMIKTASNFLAQKRSTLDRETRNSLTRLLLQANQAWWRGMARAAYASTHFGHSEKQKKAEMAEWAAALTDYAAAQTYAQMVITRLK
jgi:hypothetical protein